MSDFEAVYNAVADWTIARRKGSGIVPVEEYRAAQKAIVEQHGWTIGAYRAELQRRQRARYGVRRCRTLRGTK